MVIMSLALADLTVGCFVMPISSAYALTGKRKKTNSGGYSILKKKSYKMNECSTVPIRSYAVYTLTGMRKSLSVIPPFLLPVVLGTKCV